MPLFNIHLANLDSGGSFWGEGTMYVVGNALKDLFNRVCQDQACAFDSADFVWNPTAGQIMANEALVYFVPNQASSVIQRVRPSFSIGSDDGGNTLFQTPSGWSISEVYIAEVLANAADEDEAVMNLAQLAFHETYHNKLQQGDSMHRPSGLSSATPTNQQLNSGDIALMGPAMSRNVPQKTDYLSEGVVP